MRANKTRKKINNYVIHFDQPLGAGASGKVFLCLEEATQIWAAVKVIDKSQCKCLLRKFKTIPIWRMRFDKKCSSTAR